MAIQPKFSQAKQHGRVITPSNSDYLIYSFEPKPFCYSKTSISITDAIKMVRYELSGNTRIKSFPYNYGLVIKFIDSYSHTGSCFQGKSNIANCTLVAMNGDSWDALSEEGVQSIIIYFDRNIADKILNADLVTILKNSSKQFGDSQSIIIKSTPAALKLKEYAQTLFNELNTQKSASPNLKSSIKFKFQSNDKSIACASNGIEKALIQSTQEFLCELEVDKDAGKALSNQPRRKLALKVEELLWEKPKSLGLGREVNLDDLTILFNSSRRKIQLSLKEQFGISFISLRRIIRLHQIRSELIDEHGLKYISAVAEEYFILHLGRLSKDYKKLFGHLPSDDRRNHKSELKRK